MKKFDLDIALDNPDLVTFRDRSGLVCVAEFVYLEYAERKEQPIVIVDSLGRVTRHCADGSYLEGDEESTLDLTTEHEAKGVAYDSDDYVDTILIKWEE